MGFQLSVFMENQPGKLEAITKILAEAEINIRGISMASEGEFGVVKIIVDDSGLAYQILRERHFTVSKRRTIMVEIKDRAGGLHQLLCLLSANNINIEDCYGIALGEGEKAVIVLEVDQVQDALSVLENRGITILSDRDLV